ncbi:OLC1v1010941C2 [Oldenlandia corymbosa var. corymbosa]|uniref:OLC1v1010941C2 n=1 Tax=Oldenlandia corymbosa var. corymbosa TaxID=529605 RepID=A0AAV1DUX5_OLDCO|nr:OLC1v1010941C2 [Oldenlandia corymbosa var. corymbosa]
MSKLILKGACPFLVLYVFLITLGFSISMQENPSQGASGRFIYSRESTEPLNRRQLNAWRVLLGHSQPNLLAPQRHSSEIPHEHKENAAQVVNGRFNSAQPPSKALNQFATASSAIPVRSHPQNLESNADRRPFNAWRVLVEPPPQEQRSDIPSDNAVLPQDSLSCSSPHAEHDQRDIMTDATLAQESSSIAMTEIALRCKDSFEVDDDEVDSACDSALVTFQGYRVKEEVVPLLSKIFAKYGDIVKDSVLSCSKYRSLLLQEVCLICQDLERTNFAEITIYEVNSMLGRIDDLESVKLNVEWLRKKLTEIKETKELIGGYTAFKDNMVNMETKQKELTKKNAELNKLQQEINLLTDELTTLKIDHDRYQQNLLEMKGKITVYYSKDLVDGLY